MTRHNRGQALAEFALVFPIFLLALMGLFDIGRAVFTANSLANGAREGARLAIVNQDTNLIVQRVAAQTQVADPTVTVGFFLPPNAPAVDPTEVCSPLGVGCVVVVTAKTDFHLITPIIGNLLGSLPLEGRSVMPIEFVCPDTTNPNFPFQTSDQCPRH